MESKLAWYLGFLGFGVAPVVVGFLIARYAHNRKLQRDHSALTR